MKGVLRGCYRYSLEGPALVSVSNNDLDNGKKSILIKSANDIGLSGTEYTRGQKQNTRQSH